jgi:hypothetical protein
LDVFARFGEHGRRRGAPQPPAATRFRAAHAALWLVVAIDLWQDPGQALSPDAVTAGAPLYLDDRQAP